MTHTTRALSRSCAAVLVALLLPAGASVRAVAASAADDSALVQSAIADVQAFWTDELPNVYGLQYRPIAPDHMYPYSASNPPPACGSSGTTPYKQVAGNAFYCPDGDFVAWDQGLIVKVENRFGPLAVALVFAHELGHTIQQRTDTSSRATIPLELQADCFAGAWARHAATTANDPLRFTPRDLDHALGGFLFIRDPVGTSPSQQGAHGSAFDRVGSF